MKPLTARERRLVALGLLVLAIGALWLLVLGPLIGGFIDRAQERRDLWAVYQRNERLISSLPALRATAEAQAKLAPRFVIGAPNDALAAQAFTDRLRKVLEDEGLTATAMEEIPGEGGADSVKLRVDLTLTLTQLYETVRRLQSEDAYVVVDYLSIAADRSLSAGRLAPLDVRLEISTAWRATVRAKP